MKKQFYFTTTVILVAYLLSACGGTIQTAAQPATDTAAVKVQAVEVAFTGVVEAMSGNDWTINGQILAVDPVVVRDGPFQVGDTIKVEGTVNTDGSLSISRVEAPTAAELSDLPRLGNENDNNNDANANDGNLNSNEANTNDGNSNTNVNEDNTNDAATNANSNDDSSGGLNANFNNNDNENEDDDNFNGNANDDNGGNSNGNSNNNSNDDDDDNDDRSGNSNDDDD